MVEFIRNVFNPQKRVPYSVAALLDEQHERFIQSIWHEMEAEFDVRIPFENPIPHITHIQAGKVKRDAIEEGLSKFAKMQRPYTIRTAGIGIFTGERNAVYVPVVRNPNLTAVQTTLIASLAGSIEDIADTHLVDTWMPHLTLVMGLSGGDVDKLAAIIKRLAHRNFAWAFDVKRLALLDGDADSDEPPFTITLGEA